MALRLLRKKRAFLYDVELRYISPTWASKMQGPFKLPAESVLAVVKTLAREKEQTAPCSRLSIVPLATGPKRSMGHVLGAKNNNFLIRVADCRWHHGGRAG